MSLALALRTLAAMLTLLMWLPAGQGRAETGRLDPHARTQRPPGRGPAYVLAAAAFGQINDGDGPTSGHSISVVLRPHRAADFNHALYAANTALVLQVDKQGDEAASLISADIIMRRYVRDMRPREAGRSVFLGLGAGISRAAWSTLAERPGGSAENFSFLLETGLEWNLSRTLVLLGKGQYRLFDRGGHDHSGWSAHVGAGMPLPF